jgi:hypothetical protein
LRRGNCLSATSYRKFRTTLKRELSSSNLGEPIRQNTELNSSRHGSAYRELRKTRVLKVFLSDGFCESVHSLREEHRALEVERKKAIGVSKGMASMHYRYRTAAKSAKKCSEELARLIQTYNELITTPFLQNIDATRELLNELADRFDIRGQICVWDIHPSRRRSHHIPPESEGLLRQFDYPLDDVGIKKADQWFWVEVENLLRHTVSAANLPQLTKLTRYKVIAAISEIAINFKVPHLTIKEFLLHRSSSKRNKLQENS